MRIRKRLPALSTPPLASLYHHQPPADRPIQEFTLPAPPRSDLQLTLVKGNTSWICKTDDDCMHSNSSTVLGEEALSNTNAIGMICTAATVHANRDSSEGISISTSASHLESARRTDNSVTTRELVEVDSIDVIRQKRKKVDKDSAMPEGSRCSRVNGSGWRCWKQAVVGHSLCAHHSSQGRLRSTTSLKSEKQGHAADLSSLVLLDEEPLIKLKKRNKKKIGMVKNRSISGLLAQTEPEPAPSMPILDSVPIL